MSSTIHHVIRSCHSDHAPGTGARRIGDGNRFPRQLLEAAGIDVTISPFFTPAARQHAPASSVGARAAPRPAAASRQAERLADQSSSGLRPGGRQVSLWAEPERYLSSRSSGSRQPARRRTWRRCYTVSPARVGPDIRKPHADSVDAVEDGRSVYGPFYRVEGALAGPTGTLQVVSIWMRRAIDNRFHFVTLKPSRERSGDVPSAL